METITKTIYKSNNGKEFDTEKECLEYENGFNFEKWYNESDGLFYGNVRVNSKTLKDWLNKNKKEIVNFLFSSDFIFLQELKSLIKKPLDVNDSNDVGILIDDIEILIQRYEKILENKF